jgi:parvulin-like peptidyl-prolyl isomerase
VDSLIAGAPPELRTQPNFKSSVLNTLSSIFQAAEAARAAGLDKDPAQVTSLRVRTEQVLATAYLEDQAKKLSNDDFLKDWYQRNASNYQQWKARHILIRKAGSVVPLREGQKDLSDEEALAKATDLLAKLKAGGDFSSMAKKESDDSGSAPAGGELGFFGPGQMVSPFEIAIRGLKPGEYAEPVRTDFGYHIVQLQEIQTKPFDEVRDEIRERSAGEIRSKLIEQLKVQFPATIDPEYVNH